MRRYANTIAFRRPPMARLKQQVDETGTDLSRLRWMGVCDHIAAPLSPGMRRWTVKGGTSLEFRLGVRVRATKDFDLTLQAGPGDNDVVHMELIETLSVDVDRDGFAFSAKRLIPLDAGTAVRPRWRFSVNSVLAGKTPAQIRLDVAVRGEELAVTKRMTIPAVFVFADGPPADRSLLHVVNHAFAVRAPHPIHRALPTHRSCGRRTIRGSPKTALTKT